MIYAFFLLCTSSVRTDKESEYMGSCHLAKRLILIKAAQNNNNKKKQKEYSTEIQSERDNG